MKENEFIDEIIKEICSVTLGREYLTEYSVDYLRALIVQCIRKGKIDCLHEMKKALDEEIQNNGKEHLIK